MIDLHCHLLPGIDDGAETMEQSLELARLAVQDGITHCVVTPHIHPGRWNNSRDTILEQVEQFRVAMREQEIPLQIGFAAEVRITDLIFEQLENDHLPFLGSHDGKNLLLLEFPHNQLIPGAGKLIQWLKESHIQPVIAHPERNREVMRNPKSMRFLFDAGCYIQVTAGSLVGKFGEAAQRVAEQLLKEDKITVVASDAHNSKNRPPILSEARQRISELVGSNKARQLLWDTPVQLVGKQFADLAE